MGRTAIFYQGVEEESILKNLRGSIFAYDWGIYEEEHIWLYPFKSRDVVFLNKDTVIKKIEG